MCKVKKIEYRLREWRYYVHYLVSSIFTIIPKQIYFR